MNQDLLIRILADGIMIPIVLIAIYALIFKIDNKKRIESYSRILVAGLTTYLLAKLISVIFQPSIERPFEALDTIAGASFLNNPGFPSDHILFATAILCAVWFETKNKTLSLVIALLTIVVGVGRILALVHTPIDVIGGALIALFGSVWYLNNKQ
ncbi:MAG: phosphatase PAP2 family protein [Candidatus Saccharimonadales bacterium]